MDKNSIQDRIMDFVNILPEVKSVKAYGSSIAFQAGYKESEKKQVDLIVIVDDIKEFYTKSLKINSYMYNLVPKLYFTLADTKDLKSSASICYTSNIEYKNDTFKMGVIEKEDVIDDLLNWKTFYIAGRFQKEIFTAISDEQIERANEINKQNALTIALLMLDKEKPTTIDLYETLCSLSYMGDSRKKFKAEDPNKVKKLASGSKEFFDREYRDKTNIFMEKENGTLFIDYKMLLKKIDNLPTNLKDEIYNTINSNKSMLENLKNIRKIIRKYLTTIISTSSKGQTMKGLLTTGPINSVSYVYAKLKKGRKKN